MSSTSLSVSKVSTANCTTNTSVTGYCGTCSPYPKNCTLGYSCASDWTSCNSTAYCCAQIEDIKFNQMALAMCMPIQPKGEWI